MGFEQGFKLIACFLILLGFNKFTDGLEMIVFVNVTAVEPKRCALTERTEEPGKIWNKRHDKADAGGEEEDTRKSFIREVRAELRPASAHATKQNGKQKHLGGPKKTQLTGQRG